MASNDIGALPVAENNLLVGMVTDRDIAIRARGCRQRARHADPRGPEPGGAVML
jgi:CBS domain-containing protein